MYHSWVLYAGGLKKAIGYPTAPIPDYNSEFKMVGRLAKYYKGGLSIPEMLKMTYSEVHFWYKIYEREIAEEHVIEDYKGKNIPDGKDMERKIDAKIKKWYGITED